MFNHFNNYVMYTHQVQPKPAAKAMKKPTREDWRFENLVRVNQGLALLSYEEFESQVKSGIIK